MHKVLLVKRFALHIPGHIAVPSQSATCPLPLPTGPNDAAGFEELQTLNLRCTSFALYFLTYLGLLVGSQVFDDAYILLCFGGRQKL